MPTPHRGWEQRQRPPQELRHPLAPYLLPVLPILRLRPLLRRGGGGGGRLRVLLGFQFPDRSQLAPGPQAFAADWGVAEGWAGDLVRGAVLGPGVVLFGGATAGGREVPAPGGGEKDRGHGGYGARQPSEPARAAAPGLDVVQECLHLPWGDPDGWIPLPGDGQI